MADNITQYNAPDLSIRPAEQGAEAIARSGRFIESQYNELGRQAGGAISSVGGQVAERIQQHNDLQDISAISKASASTFAGVSSQWDAAMKDSLSSDPQVADAARAKMASFSEEVVEPALQGLQDGAQTDKGRSHALSTADSMRMHFQSMMKADSATLATHQVMTGLQQFENTTAQAVAASPSGLDFALKNIDAQVDAHIQNSGLMDPRHAIAVKEELTQKMKAEAVHAAILSTAEKNPDRAQEMLADGKYAQYIKDPSVLSNHIESVRRRNEAEQAKNEREQTRQATQTLYDKGQQLTDSLRDDTGKPTIPPDFYKQVHGLALGAPSEVKKEAFELSKQLTSMADNTQQKIAKMNAATNDPATMEEFHRREMLAPDDPQKLTLTDVMRARNEGRLTDKAYRQYTGDLKSLNVNGGAARSDLAAFNKAAGFFKTSITKSNLQMTDGPGDVRYGEFYQDMKERFQNGRAAGKTTDQLLDTRSPDSIFGQSAAGVTDYQFSKEQQRTNNRDAITTGKPSIPAAPEITKPDMARKAGEDPAAWAKRVKEATQ